MSKLIIDFDTDMLSSEKIEDLESRKILPVGCKHVNIVKGSETVAIEFRCEATLAQVKELLGVIKDA